MSYYGHCPDCDDIKVCTNCTHGVRSYDIGEIIDALMCLYNADQAGLWAAREKAGDALKLIHEKGECYRY